MGSQSMLICVGKYPRGASQQRVLWGQDLHVEFARVQGHGKPVYGWR